jgi:hypothetical protein
MIKEATTFDNRLKRVGLTIDIKKLINDDEGDPRKREIGGEESDESESDAIN